jgi:hypothetical protein
MQTDRQTDRRGGRHVKLAQSDLNIKLYLRTKVAYTQVDFTKAVKFME